SSASTEHHTVQAQGSPGSRKQNDQQRENENLLIREQGAAARHARAEHVVSDHENTDEGTEPSKQAEKQAYADGELSDHHDVAKQFGMRHDVLRKQAFVPWIEI